MKLVGYIRVSTEKQAADGVSLDAQRVKLEAYAQLYEHELVAVECDAGASAKTLDRHGLQSALARLASGEAEGIVVAKLDRLTRSVKDLGTLLDAGTFKRGSLVSVAEQIDTSTAAGRLVLNVLTSVAQWEREAIGERTSVAMQHKASLGEFIGGRIPYGFGLASDGVHLVECPAEQAVIAEARKLRAAGLSLRKVAAELERAGHVARNGRPFKAEQIRRIAA